MFKTALFVIFVLYSYHIVHGEVKFSKINILIKAYAKGLDVKTSK